MGIEKTLGMIVVGASLVVHPAFARDSCKPLTMKDFSSLFALSAQKTIESKDVILETRYLADKDSVVRQLNIERLDFYYPDGTTSLYSAGFSDAGPKGQPYRVTYAQKKGECAFLAETKDTFSVVKPSDSYPVPSWAISEIQEKG